MRIAGDRRFDIDRDETNFAMKSARASFLNSNVLVYAFTTDPRADAAQALLDRNTLWSEDMQDGLVIDDRLCIANPFRATR